MILGVVLATGTASRVDREADPLATRDGRPLVAHTVDSLLECSLDLVVGVVQPDSAVADVLDALGVDPIYDPDARGRSTSIPRAVEVARLFGADALLLAPVATPSVDSKTVECLLERYRSTGATIVAPSHGGKRGGPVLVDRRHFDALATGNEEARDDLFESDAVTRVEVAERGIHASVDEDDCGGAERRESE